MTEAKQWVEEFLKNDFSDFTDKVEIIICPPFPFLTMIWGKTQAYSFIKVGSQDVSQFEEGTYTGEVTAKTLSGIIDYAIVGHSERRRNFNENKTVIERKITLLKKYLINPILCLGDSNDVVYEAVNFVVGEPPSAISSGTGFGANLPLDEVVNLRHQLKINSQRFIYGGSVNEANARMYLENEYIDGVLPGGASLDPDRLYKIAKSAII